MRAVQTTKGDKNRLEHIYNLIKFNKFAIQSAIIFKFISMALEVVRIHDLNSFRQVVYVREKVIVRI